MRNYSTHESGRVGMRPAYNWTCEDCGRDNFVRPITIDLKNDRAMFEQVLRDCGLIRDWECIADVPDCENKVFSTYPDSVTCDHCGSQFETENPDAEMTDEATD